MQRDDDVGFISVRIRGDIACGKVEPFRSERRRRFIAISDDIFFQIESRNERIDFFYLFEIIVKRKGEVRFSRAEVDDAQRTRSACRAHNRGNDIVYEFEKAVYLPELIVLRRDDFSFGRHHSEKHEKRCRLSFGDEVIFRAVVSSRTRLPGAEIFAFCIAAFRITAVRAELPAMYVFDRLSERRRFSVFISEYRDDFGFGALDAVFKRRTRVGFQKIAEFFFRVILLKSLRRGKFFRKIRFARRSCVPLYFYARIRSA